MNTKNIDFARCLTEFYFFRVTVGNDDDVTHFSVLHKYAFWLQFMPKIRVPKCQEYSHI